MSLLYMSFSGAFFIIAVVVVRAVLINRIPKKNIPCFMGNCLFKIAYSVFHSIYVQYTHTNQSSTV